MTLELFAPQQSTSGYAAELTRRAVFAAFARTSANQPGILAGGLLSPTDLQLSAPASGLSVNVSAGEAIVPGTEGAAQGAYYFRSSAQANLALSAADPTNPRIDSIVITAADQDYTEPSDASSNLNGPLLVVVTGTPTAGATLGNLSGAAPLPASSLLLGHVLVPNGAMSVVSGDLASVATVVAHGAVSGRPPSQRAVANNTYYQPSLTRDTFVTVSIGNNTGAIGLASIMVEATTSGPATTVASISWPSNSETFSYFMCAVVPPGFWYAVNETNTGGPTVFETQI